MSCAYHSKSLTFPLSRLRSLLQTDSEMAARQMCATYGLNVSQDKVHFIKAHFKTDVKVLIVMLLIMYLKWNQNLLHVGLE